MTQNSLQNFFALTPDRILDSVEGALGGGEAGFRATGRAIALNSLENRVYEIELEEAPSVVAKFYRPGRWTSEQLLEEHAFTHALAESEVPVVAPILLKESAHSQLVQNEKTTLALSSEGLFFAVFPKVRGRITDELDDEKLRILGRYVARIHAVGSRFPGLHRLKLDADNLGERPLAFLLENNWIDLNYLSRYRNAAQKLIEIARVRLKGVESHAVHGDCHLGNTLWDGTSPFFLDFDDMMIAPPVQDLWMIIRGRDEDANRQREVFLDAYEELRPFDRSTLKLIEPLRALRLIHYSAWIARRWQDPAFVNAFPDFETPRFWEEEAQQLEDTLNACTQG